MSAVEVEDFIHKTIGIWTSTAANMNSDRNLLPAKDAVEQQHHPRQKVLYPQRWPTIEAE